MKPLTTSATSLLLSLSALVGCSQHLTNFDSNYQDAVVQAAFPSNQDVNHNLFALNQQNELLQWNEQGDKVLVVTWKSQQAIDQFMLPNTHSSESPEYPIWVSLAPQLRQFCQNYVKQHPGLEQEQLALRLKQYLGLDSNWHYDAIVSLYVKPDDLFRPCVDPETNDSSCQLEASNITGSVKGIDNYANYYQQLYFKSFRASAGVPWTGLGYTFDWGNPASRQGASEYILVPGAEYQVHAVTATEQYCHE
ncbi:hypothetical protein [Agarivorans sp. 1_MG-2023]|uniref:hypothetical protein n=1 Tax=Agarivorans sp. 1_MG-2023 TaxID=3062634 RepID=UPI0026E2B9A8|nr:hypothetical protein [Agarivorans sp. 1_MG-2023]MDO6762112.1 hypothetical protein [Agarivorans sp. 1_MG-2023]